MKFVYDIPTSFWGLFRSANRDIYIEALLAINDEYQYNNYFLSKEVCIQILSDMCNARRYEYQIEENETEEETQENLPGRLLNWLLKTKWLRKVEDYTTLTTNIVIPDYAAIMIDAFEQLLSSSIEDTNLYIQNVYATLFSFQNDSRMNLALLKTALLNTKKLNKALQDMLHNMDKFFERLLQKQSYDALLKEHLEGYVEEVVKRKYHILKTTDNFYLYKMDIKRCLQKMRDDEEWLEKVRQKQLLEKQQTSTSFGYFKRRREEDVLDLLDQIEKGFNDIEHRISNIDKEHSKYIRATVSRLNYLLSNETKRHGMLIQLLNCLGAEENIVRQEEQLKQIASCMNLSAFTVLNESPLYKQQRKKKFTEELAQDEEMEELSREDILYLNKIKHRFTKKQIEEFIEERMVNGLLEVQDMSIDKEEEFEKLILAYDMSMRKNSKYEVLVKEEQVENGIYCYPAMTFRKRRIDHV